MNAIDRRYESYLEFPKATSPASQQTAAAIAAHHVLKVSYPARGASLDEALEIALGLVPEGGEKAAGVRVGEGAAAAVLKREVVDPTAKVPEYRPRGIPGVYILTDLPALALSAYATIPWVLKTRDEVMPPPPPALNSERYAFSNLAGCRVGIRPWLATAEARRRTSGFTEE